MNTKKAKHLRIGDQIYLRKEDYGQLIGIKFLLTNSAFENALVGKIINAAPVGNHQIKLLVKLNDTTVNLSLHVNTEVDMTKREHSISPNIQKALKQREADQNIFHHVFCFWKTTQWKEFMINR